MLKVYTVVFAYLASCGLCSLFLEEPLSDPMLFDPSGDFENQLTQSCHREDSDSGYMVGESYFDPDCVKHVCEEKEGVVAWTTIPGCSLNGKCYVKNTLMDVTLKRRSIRAVCTDKDVAGEFRFYRVGRALRRT